jgi:hypothetical protein
MTKTKYRIETVWVDGTEDTGVVIEANDPDAAIELAVLRGVASGLGFRPSYRGLAAVEVEVAS